MKLSDELREVIDRDPLGWTAKVICRLVQDHADGRPIRYEELYSLPFKEFQLVVASLARSRSTF